MSFAALLEESRANKEAWRYTSLAAYEKTGFVEAKKQATPALPPPLSAARLVFVNGRWREDLSALPSTPAGLFAQDPSGLYWMDVGRQTCLALQPLELLFVHTESKEPQESETGIRLSLGANSRLTLIERHIGGGSKSSVFLPHIEISLAEQAKLVHGKVLRDAALHFSKTRVIVGAGGFYDAFTLVKDGEKARLETNVCLTGELAGTKMSGISLLREGHAESATCVSHKVPHTTSRQIFKTVLDGHARGVFQGKIFVAPEAQKTDGYQLSRALLLSDQAEMDAKPELEIYADDVKCSHGSAMGDLDEQELFYLRSRGIDEPTARALLIEAFLAEEMDKIQSDEIAKAVRKEVEQWLKRH